VVDSGVVHEHVEVAIPASYFGSRFLDARRICYIQGKRLDCTDVTELRCSSSRLCGVSCCEQDDKTFAEQLPADLESDAAISAGHQCYSSRVLNHCASPSHLRYCGSVRCSIQSTTFPLS